MFPGQFPDVQPGAHSPSLSTDFVSLNALHRIPFCLRWNGFLFLQQNPTWTDSCQIATCRYNATEDLFQTIRFKKRGKYQIRHIFPNQVYMTTSVSINKSTKNYIMALEYTEVGHAQGATAGGSARPWRNFMHSQEVNASGQEMRHLTMTMATKNKQKLFIFFVKSSSK